MTKYARLAADGIVIETFEHEIFVPSDSHVPELAAQFVVCPIEVEAGYCFNDGNWTPPSTAGTATTPPKVTPPKFYMLFTLDEQLTIERERENDPLLALWFRRLDDPRLTEVDLSLESTQRIIELALSKCHAGSVEGRLQEILTGIISF